jgi:hypothetical protein
MEDKAQEAGDFIVSHCSTVGAFYGTGDPEESWSPQSDRGVGRLKARRVVYFYFGVDEKGGPDLLRR